MFSGRDIFHLHFIPNNTSIRYFVKSSSNNILELFRHRMLNCVLKACKVIKHRSSFERYSLPGKVTFREKTNTMKKQLKFLQGAIVFNVHSHLFFMINLFGRLLETFIL